MTAEMGSLPELWGLLSPLPGHCEGRTAKCSAVVALQVVLGCKDLSVQRRGSEVILDCSCPDLKATQVTPPHGCFEIDFDPVVVNNRLVDILLVVVVLVKRGHTKLLECPIVLPPTFKIQAAGTVTSLLMMPGSEIPGALIRDSGMTWNRILTRKERHTHMKTGL